MDKTTAVRVERDKNESMTFMEKVEAVKAKAPRYHISSNDLPGRGYWYGENPYADTLIENALFCDLFPEEVPDKRDFHGFCRYNYSLS